MRVCGSVLTRPSTFLSARLSYTVLMENILNRLFFIVFHAIFDLFLVGLVWFHFFQLMITYELYVNCL